MAQLVSERRYSAPGRVLLTLHFLYHWWQEEISLDTCTSVLCMCVRVWLWWSHVNFHYTSVYREWDLTACWEEKLKMNLFFPPECLLKVIFPWRRPLNIYLFPEKAFWNYFFSWEAFWIIFFLTSLWFQFFPWWTSWFNFCSWGNLLFQFCFLGDLRNQFFCDFHHALPPDD